MVVQKGLSLWVAVSLVVVILEVVQEGCCVNGSLHYQQVLPGIVTISSVPAPGPAQLTEEDTGQLLVHFTRTYLGCLFSECKGPLLQYQSYHVFEEPYLPLYEDCFDYNL